MKRTKKPIKQPKQPPSKNEDATPKYKIGDIVIVNFFDDAYTYGVVSKVKPEPKPSKIVDYHITLLEETPRFEKYQTIYYSQDNLSLPSKITYKPHTPETCPTGGVLKSVSEEEKRGWIPFMIWENGVVFVTMRLDNKVPVCATFSFKEASEKYLHSFNGRFWLPFAQIKAKK